MSRGAVAAGLLCVAAGACSQPTPAALRVGPVSYTEAELGALDRTARRDLAALTAFGVAAAEEGLAGLTEPLARADLDSATIGRLRDEMALRRSGLSDQAIAAAYARDPETELVVRHLVVLVDENAPERARMVARARAVVALNRVRTGEPFERVAAEVSDEPGAAARGGLLEPGREGDWVADFWRAASDLEPGQVSGIVRTRYGFHVIELEERRRLPLREVRRDVAGRLVPGDDARRAARAWADSVAAGPAGTSALLAEARRLGLGPTAEERAAARADRERAAGVWAAELGFSAGAKPEATKAAAMRALSSDRQGAALTRREVLARAEVLGLYPDSSSSAAVHADTTR